MRLRCVFLLSFSGALSFGASIASQSFNSLSWGSSGVTGWTEYSVQAVGSLGLNYINVVDSSGAWLVQNLPIYESGTVSTAIGGFVGQSVQTYQTSSALTAAPAFTAATPYGTGAATYMANDPWGKTEAGPFNGPGAPPPPGTVAFANNALLGFVYHLGVPDLAQGTNECGPTSAANSLTWLNNTYNLGIMQTTAQIRDTLKDANHMKTDPATGTTDPNLIAGKNKYVSDNHLPISTHVIGQIGQAPKPQDVLDELAKGQDVELSVVWAGGGGHWVTLVGMLQIDGVYGIWYNDPDDGKMQTQFSWLTNNGTRVNSWGANTIDTTVAESVVPEPSNFGIALGALLAVGWIRGRRARRVLSA